MSLFRNTFLLGAAGLGTYMYLKYNATKHALEQLQVDISKIHDLSIDFDRLRLLIDVRISNLSRYNLGVSTWNMVRLKQLRFYNGTGDSLIGVANTNLSRLFVGAKASSTIKDIEVVIPTMSIAQNLGIVSGSQSTKIKVVLILEVFGKQYQIDPD